MTDDEDDSQYSGLPVKSKHFTMLLCTNISILSYRFRCELPKVYRAFKRRVHLTPK